MDLLHIITLALIQGITEFLPISSSGHLLLPTGLLGWPEQGLAFDVAVHVGTLTAVIFYFRKQLLQMSGEWFGSFRTGTQTQSSRLVWFLALATFPTALAGLLLDSVIESHLRTTWVVALTTVGFGLLLAFADRSSYQKNRQLSDLSVRIVLVIGCAQVLALIPGTSRSGITITAALLCGFNRSSAAQFSFLLAIPIIALSGAYKGYQLLGLMDVKWNDILIGASLSALSAFLCIHYFLRFINAIGMMPFVIYRLILGTFLLAWSFIPTI